MRGVVIKAVARVELMAPQCTTLMEMKSLIRHSKIERGV